MVARVGAQIATLSFAAAIVAGLAAGNSPSTVLTRALLVLVGAMFIGQLIGWTLEMVVRDYLQQRKHGIDREQRAAAGSVTEAPAAETAANAETAR